MPYVMNILLFEYIIREAKSSFNPFQENSPEREWR